MGAVMAGQPTVNGAGGGLGPLADGAHVVIIGGGPGGVGCALALQRMAQQAGRRLRITIVEGKQFSGQRHHNLSTGVLTPPLPELMHDHLGLEFPHHLSLGHICGYVLHTPRQQIRLEDPHDPAVAVHRVQFDQYMLEAARHRGINVLRARATDIDFHPDQVVVYTEGSSLSADVVVGAFGMDDGSAGLFTRAAGYEPPQALCSVLTHLYPGPVDMLAFGPDIHAFLRAYPGFEFGAITPKRDHLTANIAGAHVSAEQMSDFLSWPEVRAVLPEPQDPQLLSMEYLSLYKWRFPCSLAGRYYGDRYVIVGDAAGLVRAFKGKGVSSAVQTGIRAAETMMQAGISRQAFADHYAVANRDITSDLIYGRVTRLLVLYSVRIGLLDPILRAARRNEHVRESLFGAVSGHDPYRHVLAGMFYPRSVVAVAQAMLGGQ